MITQISNIRDFGIFREFKWSSSLEDFKKFNVFYGWNYSGKTTLSRLLRCYELNSLHKDFTSALFEIKIHDNRYYNQTNLDKFPFNIRVFNSDFVSDNLKWEEGIEPVLMLGEKNIELEEELNKKKIKLEDTKAEIYKLQEHIDTIEKTLNNALTDRARDVAQNLSIVRTYNRVNLKDDVESLRNMDNYREYMLNENIVVEFLKIYNSGNITEEIDELTSFAPVLSKPNDIFNAEFLNIFNAVKDILGSTVKIKVIDKLKDNPELSQWVKKGKELHEGKTTCEFCGNILPQDLLTRLNNHFSDEYENFIKKIDYCTKTLEEFRASLILPDKKYLCSELINEYVKLKELFENELEKYNTIIDNLQAKLKEKKENIFKNVPMYEFRNNTSDLKALYDKLEHIIKEHNAIVKEYDSKKNEIKNKLLRHYAAQFAHEHEYFNICSSIKEAKLKINSLFKYAGEITQGIRDIEQLLTESVKGAETINRYLKSYFGKDDIQIEATNDNKFKLKRAGVEATNLSEGEKTAISFAYFISKCHDKSTNIPDSIIFIDDPVSSLDNNHLYHTYSMIKNTFGECKQFFISTHNCELFNLMKDWIEEKPSETPHSYYLIKRVVSNETIIAEISCLPRELKLFKSEYHYLFSLIFSFNQSPSSDNNQLYLLPNLIRRLLEAFLCFKIPIYGGLKKKLPSLINNDIDREKVYKFIQEYSHNSSLPRNLKFPDFSECGDVVNIVLNSIKDKDAVHYDYLIKEISHT